MSKRRAKSVTATPDHFFEKELSGEIPPSFATMGVLYELAARLYGLHPWRVLEETDLVLTRDPVTGETCYCSVMGVLGEVLAMHAYIGTESYRLFRKLTAEEDADPGEFFATQRAVYVQFVPGNELEAPDRKMLAAFGHPRGANLASPIFRAIRPGFHPWHVTEEEGRLLAECMSAVIMICSAVSTKPDMKFWDLPDTYPMVSWADEKKGKPQCQVAAVKVPLPPEPQLSPVPVDAEQLRQLRNRDYAIRGVLEVDHFLSNAVVGGKDERKACMPMVLVVDADTGMVLPTEVPPPGTSPAEALAEGIVRAIEASRAMPREIRVKSREFKDCLAPMAELCGFTIKVARSLPELTRAKEHLLRMLAGGGFPQS